MAHIVDYRVDEAFMETASSINAEIRAWRHPIGILVVGDTTDYEPVYGHTSSMPYERFPLAVIDVGRQKGVPLYRLRKA